jgi:hypothetical protein
MIYFFPQPRSNALKPYPVPITKKSKHPCLLKKKLIILVLIIHKHTHGQRKRKEKKKNRTGMQTSAVLGTSSQKISHLISPKFVCRVTD